MVSEHLDNMSCLSEVVTVLGESVDDSVEFLVMNVPIFFRSVEFVMKQEERMPPVIVFLLEDPGICFVGGVSGEADRLAGLESADINVIPDV
jgi:hypothetical protein